MKKQIELFLCIYQAPLNTLAGYVLFRALFMYFLLDKHSIIARRLPDANNKYVQYGWSGNGGYYKNLGWKLLELYNKPEMVDYLFSLGEMEYIGLPHSEKGGCHILLTSRPAGTAHSLGKTEREIFSQIAFIDYGYFYDVDNTWYYVVPGPMRIKMPLELISNHLVDDFEFEYRDKVELMVAEEMLKLSQDFPSVKEKMAERELTLEQIREVVINARLPVEKIWDDYKFIFNVFDDWCVVDCDDVCKNITQIRFRKKVEGKHVETIEWNTAAFDYTEWQREHFKGQNLDEFCQKASEWCEDNPI